MSGESHRVSPDMSGAESAPRARAKERDWLRQVDQGQNKELVALKNIQEQIAKLEATLRKGIDETKGQRNPALKTLAIELGRKVTQELDVLREKEVELKMLIEDNGGNPDDRTVQ